MIEVLIKENILPSQIVLTWIHLKHIFCTLSVQNKTHEYLVSK